MMDLARLKPRLATPGRVQLSGVPQGLDAMLLPRIASALAPRPLVHVALDDQRLSVFEDQLAFFAPGLEIVRFPAWDCLPYDRVSPAADIVARRLATLARLTQAIAKPIIVLTTINAVLQRVVPRHLIESATFTAAPSQIVNSEKLLGFLAHNGFSRTGTVVDPGDFAVRGGIIDIYPPGADTPVRLDFFGDKLESLRSFDPQSQRSLGALKTLHAPSRQ